MSGEDCKLHSVSRFVLVLVLVLVLVPDLFAQSPEVSMTLGQGWAVVREQRTLLFTNRQQSFVLDGIPREADLATLTVHGRRVPYTIHRWHTADQGSDARPGDPGLSVASNGADLVWRPGDAEMRERPGTPRSTRLICELSAPSTGAKPVEVVYFTTGITWAAHYSVLLRGDLEKEDERVSAEFDGAVRIVNSTARSYLGAEVLLVCADASPEEHRGDEPGFLMLDDESPLSDLWRLPASQSSNVYEYALRVPATLPAQGDATIALTTAARQPAERIYKLVADDLPVTGRQRAQPLRRQLVLKNTSQSGLGFALPPGEAQVFLGSTRSVLLQKAWFSHTPANGQIHVDLGFADQVVASRKKIGREQETPGDFLETYALVLENLTDGPVQVEVDETPPTALAWDVVRSRITHTQRGRHLYFSTRIGGKAQENIEYTIRVHEPTL